MFGRAIQLLVGTAVGAGLIYLASQARNEAHHSDHTGGEDSIEQQYRIYRDSVPSIVSPTISPAGLPEFKARFVSATQDLERATLFGHEFTFFIPDEASPNQILRQWQTKMKDHCEEACRIDNSAHNKFCCDVIVDEIYDEGFRVSYTDGWWYEVKRDSGVLEITGRPQTAAEIADNEERIQNQVFDLAKNTLNIVPHEFEGGGHIHIGVASGFKNSASLLRNFFVDIENHPAMFLGAISNSIGNSPLAIENETSREVFKMQLDKFDREVMSQNSWNDTVKIIFFSDLLLNKPRKSAIPMRNLSKFHVVNVEHISRDMKGKYTLEIRGLLPQKNAREYTLLVRLFDARIEYLKQNYKDRLVGYEEKTMDYSRVIVLNNRGERTNSIKTDRKTKLPVVIDPKKSLDEFNDYVLESGLDPRDFNALLKSDLQ